MVSVHTMALESKRANLKLRSDKNLLSREPGIRWFLAVLSSRGKILGNFEGPLFGKTLFCQSWWRHTNSKLWYFANFYPTGQESPDSRLCHLFNRRRTCNLVTVRRSRIETNFWFENVGWSEFETVEQPRWKFQNSTLTIYERFKIKPISIKSRDPRTEMVDGDESIRT